MNLHLQTAVVSYMGQNIIMRGALPAADSLYAFDNTLPPTITDCYVACSALVGYSGVTVKYFRCYNYTLSNNDNYNTVNLNANYPNCNSMLLLFSKINTSTYFKSQIRYL